MKRVIIKSVILIVAFFGGAYLFDYNNVGHKIIEQHSVLSPHASVESKKGRAEYFFRMLRDPKTNRIPAGIREKELAFAEKLSQSQKLYKGEMKITDLSWEEVGPFDVGGRTRALAIDKRNPNIIIAGGATGGIWKSTNKGETWELKSTPSQISSITSVVQDPRSGHNNTWYYSTGEFGCTGVDRGHTTAIHGEGIFKSTDNGENWFLLPVTKDENPTVWNNYFNVVSRLAINPITGSLFVACNGMGIVKFRERDGGEIFFKTLTNEWEHIYNEIDISENGIIAASLSIGFKTSEVSLPPGIHISSDDGSTWNNITPENYPEKPERCVLDFSASNPSILYALVYTGEKDDDGDDVVRFYKFNITNNTFEDRSANMPDFDENIKGNINTQGNYNLTLAVKPDNENFVMIGATNLFRSTNGFSTKPNNLRLDWIGGYHPESYHYPNLHCDIHSFAFDPTDPNKMWWGHDGGLSYTDDIRTTDYNTFFPWENMNNGYNVTQFYTITIPEKAGDNRIMGGTQDNGTPFFRWNGTTSTPYLDVSGGDGAYAYFGKVFCYSSAHEGTVFRRSYVDGTPNHNTITLISPTEASDQLFINPFVVDPNDENVMWYPAGNVLWRNDELSSITEKTWGTMIGWSEMKELSFSEDYKISAMEVSKNNPEHLFYYGASSDSNKPIIYKLPDGHTETTGAIDISIPNVAEGAYLHNITVNPNDGNEIILVFSNYNITGLFHSTDGGENYTAVEGNLTGDEQEPGPSLRGATILPTPEGGIYFVGTSVGLFSTDNLNGVNTVWIKEGEEKMGNVIVNYVTSRKSDGKVVAGSHGRGAFQTKVPGFGTPSVLVDSDQLHIDCLPDSSASCFFNISNSGVGELNYYITASGSFENSANSKKIFKNLMIGSKINRRSKNPSIKSTNVSGNRLMGSDVLILDDGDQTADDFIGYYNNTTYGAVNEYLLDETGFNLEEIRFYSRSENSLLNEFFVAVYDKDLNNLWSGYKSFDLAQNGAWFNIKLPNVIEFNSGSKFYIHLESNYSFIDNPYGFDQDAQVSGHSYYFDFLNENLINMNTISGYENGAFLIRAVGTLSSSINEEPVAIASVSNANPDVEEMVTFDASQSYDNDGQIVEYHWDFGDGKSAYTNISYHTYSNAGNYTYTLRVTDDDGASDQTSGEIIVTGLTPTQRFALSHSNGTLQAGQSQQVRLDFFSQDLSEGNYNGEVNITSNGGNKTIPLSIRVDKSVNVEEADDLPINFTLSQNYPNPFNPVTNIEFHIPQKGNVELKVYDITGREVVTLLNEEKTPGKYNVAFDGSALASGVYFYRIKTSEFAASKKCLLVK